MAFLKELLWSSAKTLNLPLASVICFSPISFPGVRLRKYSLGSCCVRTAVCAAMLVRPPWLIREIGLRRFDACAAAADFFQLGFPPNTERAEFLVAGF